MGVSIQPSAACQQRLSAVQLEHFITRMRMVREGEMRLLRSLEVISCTILQDREWLLFTVTSQDLKGTHVNHSKESTFLDRNAILQAALDLTSRNEVRPTRRQIAKKAGVTTATLQRHFRCFAELRTELAKVSELYV